MNIRALCSIPFSLVLALPLAAPAAVLEGEVTLDYFVADVDSEGFEQVDAGFYVERLRNDDTSRSGSLSLEAWATRDATPAGAGDTLATLGTGSVAAGASLLDVGGTAAASDAAPGEYDLHVLLQDDRYEDWDDVRTLTPRLLWRGGLEAVGLEAYPDAWGRWIDVSLSELRNNRRDARYTNAIELTLYATHGYGPASTGHVLCSVRVPGLYAGDAAWDERFGCATDSLPDGEYTLHVEVAEAGGRGGASTVTGPDIEAVDGGIREGGCCGDGYVYAAGSGPALLLPLLAFGALSRRRPKR